MATPVWLASWRQRHERQMGMICCLNSTACCLWGPHLPPEQLQVMVAFSYAAVHKRNSESDTAGHLLLTMAELEHESS